MIDEVLEFIRRRFPTDSHWLDGNCYYFSLILKNRFDGSIYYDVVNGHFLTEVNGKLYDWEGLKRKDGLTLIKWDEFDVYDPIQKQRIIRDCLS